MMKKSLLIFLVLVSMLFVLIGCSGKKSGYKAPEFYGVFLVKNGDLLQIPTGEYFSVPNTSDLKGAPTTSETQPLLVFNYQNLNLSYLQFFAVNKRQEITYNAAPKKDGIVEISPTAPLAPGGYCFIQGNPIAAFLDGWCFQVNGDDTAGSHQGSADTDTVYGASTERKPSQPLPFATAGGLAVGLAGLTAVLWRKGLLQAWSTAGISASKWNVQSLRLSTEVSRLQREIGNETDVLGKLAWDNRVSDPAYSGLFSQLEELEGIKSEKQAQKNGLQNELSQVQQTRAVKNNDFSSRLADLQNRKKSADSNLSALAARKNASSKRMQTIQAEIEKTANEAATLKQRLEANQSSTAPDKDEQATVLTNAIAAVEQAHEKGKAQVIDLQAELSGIDTQAGPLQADIEELGKQITSLTEEQRNTITPLDNQIRDLQEAVRRLEGEISTITNQMAPMIKQLGPAVEKTRPETLRLKSQYGVIDKLKGDMNNVVQQNSLLKARLSTNDSKAVRNFFLAIALYVIVIGAIIILVATNI